MTDFRPVKSALRVFEVIDLLKDRPSGMTLADVQKQTGWPTSSTYQLMQTMVQSGYIDFDTADRTYSVGLRLWEAGQAYQRSTDLVTRGTPFLRAVCERVNETVQLAVLDHLDNVYIAKVEADHHLKLVSDIGMRLPAYATGLGKVLLSGLDPDELDTRLEGVTLEAFTPATVTDVEELKKMLSRVRADGYALDQGEFTAGVFCVAVPVHGPDDQMVAAMSVSVPYARSDNHHVDSIREILDEEASALSRVLGKPTAT